jgi:6,7-dimethyl-8-ribityllumazine synthase
VAGTRLAVVVSEFHSELTLAMLESAQKVWSAAGLAAADLEVARVPGAFELPIVARRFARRADIDAVVCMGLVLKGETTHDQWVAHAATEGILKVGLDTDTPVLFGVLTCDTLEQARARALPQSKGGIHDKGGELARAALQVLAALDVADGTASDSQEQN